MKKMNLPVFFILLCFFASCNTARKAEPAVATPVVSSDTLTDKAYNDSIKLRKSLESRVQERRAIRKQPSEGKHLLIE